ncbi:hypothetical protein ACW9HQ_37940, partial [Nocardia gipuzkoensis]
SLGLVVTTTTSKSDVFHSALADPTFRYKWALEVVLALFVAATVVTAGFVYRALVPRTAALGRNRFAWPSVAVAAPEVDRHTTLDDAWSQNHALALIAEAKYAAFKGALRAFGAALASSGIAIAVATWQTANIAR